MQSRDFCYWLQGFFELSGDKAQITAHQAALIRRHLDLVFAHEIDTSLREREQPVIPRPTPAPEPPPSPEPLPEREPLPVPYPQPTPMC